MSGLEKILTMVLGFLIFLCVYFYWRLNKAKSDTEETQPLDTVLISWFALLFVFIIFCFFVYFSENKITIAENIGQVGDFIGGLTNPVLSFLALLVLLRTTSIQTTEARKTTRFMALQQELLEKEKFENTFFKILDQLESYCERHFRLNVGSGCYGEEVAEALCAKYDELSKLGAGPQLVAAKKLIFKLTEDTNCIILRNRAMRVVRFLNSSNLDIKTRKSYAAILRDTIYPDECIILASICFVGTGASAQLLKEWKVVHLNRGFFPCKEIEYFYKGVPDNKAGS